MHLKYNPSLDLFLPNTRFPALRRNGSPCFPLLFHLILEKEGSKGRDEHSLYGGNGKKLAGE